MWEKNEMKFVSMIPSQLEIDTIAQTKIESLRKDLNVDRSLRANDYVGFQRKVFEIYNPKNLRQPYVLMTINPIEGVDFLEFDAQIENTVDSWFEWCVRTFELSKTGRLHAHILACVKPGKRNGNFGRIKDAYIKQSLCGNAKHIDIRYVPEEQLQKTYSYITKQVCSDSKSLAHQLTLKWREENRIPPLFSRGDIPTCLSPLSTELINLNSD